MCQALRQLFIHSFGSPDSQQVLLCASLTTKEPCSSGTSSLEAGGEEHPLEASKSREGHIDLRKELQYPL